MFRPLMVAIIGLYTLKLVNYYNMQIQFDVEFANFSVYKLMMATMRGRNM
jgi:hypothetical protein